LLKKVINFAQKAPFFSTLLLVLAMAVSIYLEFLITGTSFLLSVGDAYHQTWPYLVSLSDYIRSEGYPMWSFGIGLGSPYAANLYGNPFLLVPVLLGRDAISYVMVIMQICKIVMAFSFFYLFLKKLGFHPFTCSTVSILYAFCGIMVTRGVWNNYGAECAIAAFILYAMEVYLKDGKWRLLPVSIFLLLISFGVYYLYLYVILIFIYSTARYLYAAKFHIKEYVAYILKIAGLCSIGVLMSGFIFIPYIFSMFGSFRFEKTADSTSIAAYIMNLFKFDNAGVYLSAFYRFFSSDVLGVFYKYSGALNCLEGPLFYCGLINLLLMPQAFYLSDKKTRRFFMFGIFASLAYLVFPNIHLLLNGFIRVSFKLSSLWICVVLLVITACAVDAIANGSVLNKKILLATFAFLVIVFINLLNLLWGNGISFSRGVSVYVTLFLLAYTMILYHSGRLKRINMMKALFFLVVFEACIFSRITVRTQYKFASGIAENETDSASKKGYYDYAADAIALIKSADHGFFRLEKNEMVLLSDSLFNGYYGSTYYDSFVSKSYIDFLSSLETGGYLHYPIFAYSSGLQKRPLLDALTGFKYQIASLGDGPPFGYKKVDVVGDRVIYRNDDALPLALVYDSYISRDDFDNLDLPAKDMTLLSAVVTEEPCDNLAQYSSPLEVQYAFSPNFDDAGLAGVVRADKAPDGFEGIAVRDDPAIIIRFDELDFPKRAMLTEFDLESDADTVTRLSWGASRGDFNDNKNITYSLAADEKKRLKFFIVDDDISKLRVEPGKQANFKIENFRVKTYDLYDIYKKALNDRKKEPFVMTSFSQNHIKGTIDVAGDRILFFSIPYSSGWKLKIDGEPTQTEKINIGFIGAKIGAGKHTVELDYFLPGLMIGGMMSAVGCMLYIVMLLLGGKTHGVQRLNSGADL
jgi:uncharacterized membrane protein YfhO